MGKKKEKITYVDDGRTIADMSGVASGSKMSRHAPGHRHSSFREVWKTYWNATKMMLVPMLVVVGAICVISLIMYLWFYVM